MSLFHEHTGRLRTWARRTIWFIVIVGILCAIVIPIFMIYRKEGADARSAVDVDPQGVSHTGDFIHVVATVSSVDFEDKNYRVHFEFTPHGTLAGDDGILTEAIEIALFYTTLSFPEGQIMRSVDVTMPYTRGAPIDYPFDRYVSYFEILIHKEKEKLHKVPVSFTFLAMLQTVEFVPVLHLDPSDTYKIAMQITTNRSPTTIGFSLFIVVIMWALSISIGIITIQVVRKHRESDEHILTLGITTLFALPALRETQPGIPAIGCAADVLGFYWNMAIIAIASICVLLASALRWKEPSIKKELELIRMQNNYQSRLIQEMTVPMPFPLTGGPFTDRLYRKKRVPFMHANKPPTASGKASPSPSLTKRMRQESKAHEDDDGHWSFSDLDDDLNSLRRFQHGRERHSRHESHRHHKPHHHESYHDATLPVKPSNDPGAGERRGPTANRPSYEQLGSIGTAIPSGHSSLLRSLPSQQESKPPRREEPPPSSDDGDSSCVLIPLAPSENSTGSDRSQSPTKAPESLAGAETKTASTTLDSAAGVVSHKALQSLGIQSPPREAPYRYPRWNESTPILIPPASIGARLHTSRHPASSENLRSPSHLYRTRSPTQSSTSLFHQSLSRPTPVVPAATAATTTAAATASKSTRSSRRPPSSTGHTPESNQKSPPTRIPVARPPPPPPSPSPSSRRALTPLKETTLAALNQSLTGRSRAGKSPTRAAAASSSSSLALGPTTAQQVRATTTAGGMVSSNPRGSATTSPMARPSSAVHRNKVGVEPCAKADMSIVEMGDGSAEEKHPDTRRRRFG